MFEIDLKNQVPSYAAEKPNWGGPAAAQMAMNGYPSGATSCYISQTKTWNYIQAHNKEPGIGSWGIGWYADPYAVTKALNDLCPPQHRWIDVSSTDKLGVLYALFRYMANYKYASLICTFAHDYWKALVYYRTSADPRTSTNPTLDYVGFYAPYTGGVKYQKIDGATWLKAPPYWGQPCPSGKIWKNKWVGIAEPPDEEGTVQVEEISRVGTALISPDATLDIAREILAQQNQDEPDYFARISRDVEPQPPLLVRELPFLDEERSIMVEVEEGAQYYIVPFALGQETDESGSRLAKLSVLINAFTGRFEGLSVFPRPVRYLYEEEVLDLATMTLGISSHEIDKIAIEAVARPYQWIVSTDMPAWQVSFEGSTFYITQEGLVLGSLYDLHLRGS